MGWLEKVFGQAPSNSVTVPFPTTNFADFVVIDVETACSRVSSICQVGIVGFSDGREAWAFESLVDPRDEFHDFNVRLHGINAHHVRGKPTFEDLHPVLTQHMAGRVTVAHSNFDRCALSAACDLYRAAEIETRWLDSVRVARHAWPELPSHRLNILTAHLGIAHRHHDALSDARATGQVVLRAMDLTGKSLDELFGPLHNGPPPSKRIKRRPAGDGPLAGECVCVSGDLSVGRSAFADEVAAAGGAVSATPMRKTTIMVLGDQDPSKFAPGATKSAKHLKAEELVRSGQAIRFLSENELRNIIG